MLASPESLLLPNLENSVFEALQQPPVLGSSNPVEESLSEKASPS